MNAVKNKAFRGSMRKNSSPWLWKTSDKAASARASTVKNKSAVETLRRRTLNFHSAKWTLRDRTKAKERERKLKKKGQHREEECYFQPWHFKRARQPKSRKVNKRILAAAAANDAGIQLQKLRAQGLLQGERKFLQRNWFSPGNSITLEFHLFFSPGGQSSLQELVLLV